MPPQVSPAPPPGLPDRTGPPRTPAPAGSAPIPSLLVRGPRPDRPSIQVSLLGDLSVQGEREDQVVNLPGLGDVEQTNELVGQVALARGDKRLDDQRHCPGPLGPLEHALRQSHVDDPTD